MKQHLSLQFLKDLIDFNLLKNESLAKKGQLTLNTLNILNLNKEFKMFVKIIRQVVSKKYDCILILVEDPFLYQLLLKKALTLKFLITIPLVISIKHRNLDNILNEKKILTINISSIFENKNRLEDFLISISNKNNVSNQKLGTYRISSDINTVKTLIFFLTLIINLLKVNK